MNNPTIDAINGIFLESNPTEIVLNKADFVRSLRHQLPNELYASGKVELIPVGSCFHNTATPENSGADVILNSKLFRDESSKVVRTSAFNILYRTHLIDQKTAIDSKVVTTRFIPARTMQAGTEIMLPSNPDHWIPADPEKHETAMENLSSLELCIIRTFKVWNCDYDVGLSSFEIETLDEENVSATITINNYIKTTYACILFQMGKDFKELKPVRSNPK